MEKPIRTFIAFELPADMVQLVAELQRLLEAESLNLRWVRPRNIHLTLKFLGEMPPDRVDAVAVAMQAAACAVPPLALTAAGMGLFPNTRRPRVLWVGLGGQIDGLHQLQARLEAQLAPLGFGPQRRPFKAHLTLARINPMLDHGHVVRAIEKVGQFAPKPFQASELVLFQSDLRPQGAIYSPLAGAPLG